MRNIAIIPARGGSVRIPRKNIREFCGKPIIAYSIELAIKSGLFDKVIVSTDDLEIAEIAKQYGAEVPFLRPDNISDEYTGTNEVISHAVRALEKQGDVFDYACCIYATAPLLGFSYLKDSINKLLSNNDKSLSFGVTKFNYPVQRSFVIDESDNISILQPEHLNSRSQDLSDIYHDAGQFYWAKAEEYLADKVNYFSSASIPVIIPNYLVQDIDDEDDWMRAELMYQALKLKSNSKI